MPIVILPRCHVELLAFWQSLEGAEGVDHADVCGKDVPGRGNSKCKGPGASVSHSEAMWLESSRAPEGKASERAGARPTGPAILRTDLGFHSE